MTVNQNRDSLRIQIIAAMNQYALQKGWADRSFEFNAEMFEEAIFPVLDAAMKAGELLMHRATTPVLPVSDGIMVWLEQVTAMIADLHTREDTVSRRTLLNALYQFEESANMALADARVLKRETTSMDEGNLLAGQSIPVKG